MNRSNQAWKYNIKLIGEKMNRKKHWSEKELKEPKRNHVPTKEIDVLFRRKYANATLKRKQDFINECKNKPCSVCGNSFPACAMDFHHFENKKESYPKGYRNITGANDFAHMTKERFLSEIKKCILICSNCHRVLHFNIRREQKLESELRKRQDLNTKTPPQIETPTTGSSQNLFSTKTIQEPLLA
jgi:predicted HNH restriction endonuclease